MRKQIVFTVLLVVALMSSIKGYSQLSIDGELRPRGEIRNGFKQVRDSTSKVAGLISQRSRITMKYKSEVLITKISLQDVRVWGDEKVKQDVPSMALHEAWAGFKVVDSLSLKIGRQELSYGNERLLGSANWLQQAMSHDAVVAKYKSNGFTADLGLSFNQTHDTILSGTYYSYNKTNYKSLDYLWLSQKFNSLTISALLIGDNYQKTKDTSFTRYTYGGIADYKDGSIESSANFYLQSGKTQTGQEISAYYFSFDLAYALGKVKPAAGIEYFSGNDNSNTSNKKWNAFNTLYGTGHKFNGSMEYFLASAATKNAGLVDVYLGAAYKATDKITCKADYHYFSIQSDFLNAKTGQKIDKYLGSEVDLSVKADFNKEISLLLGYSFLSASKSLEILQGRVNDGRLNSWAFAMLTLKPKFL